MTAPAFVIGEMGGDAKTLKFFVPGRVPSNNRNIRSFKGHPVKNPEAIDYQSKVAVHAQAAVNKAKWAWPPACTVYIVHWNGRLDWDNVPKVIVDAMRAIVYPDDRSRFVRGGGVFTDFDGGEEGVEIIVQACDSRPEIVRRKCGFCLDSRPGVRAKPFVCGRCAARRRRNLIA